MDKFIRIFTGTANGQSTAKASSNNNKDHMLKEKIKELPIEAQKSFKLSGLSSKEVTADTWDSLLLCLYTTCKSITLKNNNGVFTLIEKDLITPGHSSTSLRDFLRKSSGESEAELETVEFSKDPSSGNKKLIKKEVLETDITQLVERRDARRLYEDFKSIGDGAFGQVESAIEKESKIKVAIKLVRKPFDQNKERILNEIKILKTCNHPNIVGYLNSYLYNNQISIVMEYCDAGSLRSLIQSKWEEKAIVYVIYYVLHGLQYLHSMNRIHRDIKSSNVLLTNSGDIKICDMGLCTETKRKGMAGSKFWCAPEMIKTLSYDHKVDIWSVGALAYEMAESHPPYREFKSLKALFLTVTVGAPNLSKPKRYSPEFRDFLNLCFQVDPVLRPPAEELLKHDIFKNVPSRSSFVKQLRYMLVAQTFSGI